VLPAGRLEDYVARPVGRYYAGPTFLHFFYDERLSGLILWSRPDADDARRIARAIDAELPAHGPRHASLVDARRLVEVDRAGFDVLVGYFAATSATLGSNVTRHALVRPPGVVGAIIAGFWDVAPSSDRERTRIFDDAREAAAWLGRADAAAVLAAMDGLHAAATGATREVQAVRDLLAAKGGRATLAVAARELGVSSRTLQDRLRHAGTSFRSEANRARIARAEELLLGTSDNLTAIALEVGCASLAHFSALFRKVTGESPSAWRAKRLPAEPRG
jgi:AraC-like DNA-binding protein